MGSAKWWAVTDWYIDPAATHGGSDENDGLTSTTPIKSIAEWRRRVRGAHYESGPIVIHALSSSTAYDDGLFYGFTTGKFATFVVVLGTPTIMFASTITAYQAYSGNTRGSITDSSLTSWTASDAISASAGSRFIRKAGTGTRQYAPLLADLGSKTVQFGVVSNWDETDATTVSATETNFTNGDAYQVVSMPTWPAIQAMGVNVRAQCLDILGVQGGSTQVSYSTAQYTYALCGIPAQLSLIMNPSSHAFSCVFCKTGVINQIQGSISVENCAFVGNTAEITFTGLNWNGFVNVFVNSTLDVFHAGTAGSLGTLRFYDVTTTCLSVNHIGRARIGSLVGSGNSGKLVTVTGGSICYGAGNVTATTSDGSPYSLAGSSSASPSVNATTGDGIYT